MTHEGISSENRAASKSIKQFFILAFAQYGSLVVAFVSNILITMYLSEEIYGSYRYIVSILTVVDSLGNLGIYYSSARLLTKANKTDTTSIYSGTVALILFICVLASLGLLIASFISKANSQFFRIAALFTFSVILQRAFVCMLKGSNRVIDIAIQTIAPQGLILVLFLILTFAKKKEVSLTQMICIYGISYAIVHVFTIIRLKACRTNGIFKAIKGIFIEQRTNGIQIYIGSLVSVCLSDILNIIVATISGKSDYASYALSVSIAIVMMQIPVIMATINFKNNANRERIWRKDISITVILLLISFLGLNIAVQTLFPFIYGGKYVTAPNFIFVLSIGYGLHGMGDYFSSYLNAKGCGKLIRNASIITGITQLCSACVLIPLWGLKGLLFTRVLTSVVYFLVIIIMYRKQIRRNSQIVVQETIYAGRR